ncbi:Six-hairpin glycosidase-like protein [Xylariales sp. PMI_506]|nr:Six-hairpin glycosidase-like protein [Xylariales sp. PMI_506]
MAAPILLCHAYSLVLVLNARQVFAQTCWRTTPCSDIQHASFPGEWDSYNFAPSSRTVIPAALLETVTLEKIVSWPGVVFLDDELTSVVFDFGFEVGGIATIDFAASTSGFFGLAFTEARNFIGPASDSSNGNFATPDGAIYVDFNATDNYTYVMPDEKLRGGFRYLTLFLQKPGVSVSIYNVSLELSIQPTWSNLQAYQGYFSSNDDILNKIWYSGAYTLQTDAIPPQTGRSWPPPSQGGWQNTGDLGPGNSILTDGAKRDRTVWPGDLGVAVPASFYSTGDLESTGNALQTMYHYQNLATGQFPFSGPPLLAEGSDAYHLWTMIGTYNYIFYTNDVTFLTANWVGYKLGMKFAFSQHSLVTGASLADWAGDTTGLKDQWQNKAAEIRSLTYTYNWDVSAGAFFDTAQRTQIHPQDGNSLAVLFGLVDPSSAEASSISTYLVRNWTPIGAECEELPGEISPFISSFEIQAHMVAGQSQRALDLIHSSWGWYLQNENGTQSTMIEGYLINGTFGYRWDQGYGNDFSYTSHAHGWATGPVTALTEHVLGLSITGRAGATWQLAPQINYENDLTHVEGGFTTALGKFSAKWTRQSDGSLQVVYDTPNGTTGDVILPIVPSVAIAVIVNGALADKGEGYRLTDAPNGRKVVLLRSEGGKHSVLIQ